MSTEPMNILITGMTGNQGRAVTHQLLEKPSAFDVYGLTRDPTTVHAEALRDLGVTTVQGTLDDPTSFETTLAEMDAIFSMTRSAVGYEREIANGVAIADAAAAVDVDHFVFSSIIGADRATEIGVFEAKRKIEQHVTDLDLSVTILRPTWFTYNLDRHRNDVRSGRLALPLADGVTLPILNVGDYGQFATQVFSDPERYTGQTIEIAGDEQTLESMASILSDVVGKPIEPIHVPIDELPDNEYTAMYRWFNRDENAVDISAFETMHGFQFTSLESYLRQHSWSRV